MKKMQEMVLYYRAPGGVGNAEETEEANAQAEKANRMLKSVLVRLGVRIKNIGPDQVTEKVGYLAGLPGYEAEKELLQNESGDETEREVLAGKLDENLPYIGQDVLVMKNFTSGRIDVLLAALRKAGVPKIALKAVLTPQNADWSFYQLYQELVKEHQAMGSSGV